LDRPCPDCRSTASLVASNELSWEEETEGLSIAIFHLKGEKCGRCGAQWFDTASYDAIQRHRQRLPRANYEASVTRLGGESLGLYIPKDVQRVMGLQAKTKVLLTPLSDTSLLLHFGGTKAGAERSRIRAADRALGLP